MKSAKAISSILLAILLTSLPSNEFTQVSAFGISPQLETTLRLSTSTSLAMVPRFNPTTNLWEPVTQDDETQAGYGPIGSLARAGPLPFFQRIFKADDYDQGVLKYMAKEGVDRMEAQGNMDAYFENPNDWTIQKLEEKKGGYKRDYAMIDQSQLVLSGVWAVVVVTCLYFFIKDGIIGNWEILSHNAATQKNIFK